MYMRETISRPNAIVVWGSQAASLSKGLRMKIKRYQRENFKNGPHSLPPLPTKKTELCSSGTCPHLSNHFLDPKPPSLCLFFHLHPHPNHELQVLPSNTRQLYPLTPGHPQGPSALPRPRDSRSLVSAHQPPDPLSLGFSAGTSLRPRKHRSRLSDKLIPFHIIQPQE